LKWKTVHILQAASTQARRCFHKTLFVKESSILTRIERALGGLRMVNCQRWRVGS
jgi:hypothetical protein